MLVAKYAWHLPLYRQVQMLAAQGLTIKRSMLAFWVGYAAAEAQADLFAAVASSFWTSGKIAVDETVAPVLDPGRGRTKQGYFWAIARDDRPWSGTDPPAIAYSYAPGRGAIYALKLLEGYRGIVQCDGYAAYKTVADAEPGKAITLAFCWTHLRRKFFDIAKGGNAPIASEALERIAALYAIEKTIRGHRRRGALAIAPPGTRSRPLVVAFGAWLERQASRRSPARRRSPTPSATACIIGTVSRAFSMTAVSEVSSIPISSKEASARSLLNRKNALFAGHDQGAENWACIASLIETCEVGRRRSASLRHRRAHQVLRQPLAGLPHRSVDALGLGRSANQPARGVTRRSFQKIKCSHLCGQRDANAVPGLKQNDRTGLIRARAGVIAQLVGAGCCVCVKPRPALLENPNAVIS